ncbi:serine-type endopeptidase inhibitor [Holotrichia oblita]|uniref:Serine-type endopeptidase inhibitor n=1 Tax=Holotrichia oblita TaxID=644536 RepID=A0ACB9SX84_HOLOL|nr:serine-type endopeptidase inhibitor [Holotrichia oblita]
MDSSLAHRNSVYNDYWDSNPVWGIQKSGRPQRQIPQNFPNSDAIVFEDDYPNPNVIVPRPTTQRPRTTTFAIPGMGTTRSPCEQFCLVTSEYDPICGTDGVTYSNSGRLNCAINCGKLDCHNRKLAERDTFTYFFQELVALIVVVAAEYYKERLDIYKSDKNTPSEA